MQCQRRLPSYLSSEEYRQRFRIKRRDVSLNPRLWWVSCNSKPELNKITLSRATIQLFQIPWWSQLLWPSSSSSSLSKSNTKRPIFGSGRISSFFLSKFSPVSLRRLQSSTFSRWTRFRANATPPARPPTPISVSPQWQLVTVWELPDASDAEAKAKKTNCLGPWTRQMYAGNTWQCLEVAISLCCCFVEKTNKATCHIILSGCWVIRFLRYGYNLRHCHRRPEMASDVISGRFVGPVAPDNRVKFGDPRLKLSREIPPEAVSRGIFDCFFSR